MKNPLLLSRFLRSTSEMAISESLRNEWLTHPCAVLTQRQLLVDLQDIWDQILAAKSWDEFCALRGAYGALEKLVALEDLVDIGPSPNTPDEIEELRQKLQEIVNGNE